MVSNNNSQKKVDSTTLTDYDLVEIYIRSVEVFVDVSSRLDLEQQRCFDLGKVLCEKSIEFRDEYRKRHPDKGLTR